jgi:hypothetical protein
MDSLELLHGTATVRATLPDQAIYRDVLLTSRISPIYTRAYCLFTQNIHALNLKSLGIMARSESRSGFWSVHGASGRCPVPEFPIREVSTAVLGMPNSSVEAMQDSGRHSGSAPPPSSSRYGLFGSKPKAPLLSFNSVCRKCQPMRATRTIVRVSGIRKDYYIFMTALVDLGGRWKRTFGSATWIHLISLRMPEHSVESRMLPKSCKCLMETNFGSPGCTNCEL